MKKIIQSFFYDKEVKDIDVDSILEAIKMDKKNSNGKVRWVLLESIGKAIISQDVKEEIVIKSINDILI